MTNFKKNRIVNKELLKEKRKKCCAVCNNFGPNDPHHIKSVGSGGHDTDANVIPLCRKHHTEIHAIGLNRFCEKYEEVCVWLSKRGWAYNPKNNRWMQECQ